MNTYEKFVRYFFEKYSGFDVDRIGKWSFLITNQKFRSNAWASNRCQLRSIIESMNIDLVIDAGANEGQFGKSIRKFYSGELHSFEPVSSVYALLSKSASSDPKWHTHQFALGSDESEQDINVANFSVFSSLLEMNKYSGKRFGNQPVSARKERISIRRLDNVIDNISSENENRRIFLKMDTQGFDLEVFKGLGNKLQDVYAIQSELSVIPIYNGMPHWTESILAYEKSGFRVAGMFPVTRDSWSIIEYDCLLVRATS